MGAILAIMGEAGDPELGGRLQRMIECSPYRGESEFLVEGPLAIGIQSMGWDASLHSAGNWLVAFHGFIGNWGELAPAHGLRFPENASNAHRFAIAYEAFGDDLFANLRGEWAVVILDRHRSELLTLRDVIGYRPLFRSESNGRFFIASEIRQILSGTGETPHLNNEVMLDALLNNSRVSEETTYMGVPRILPATVCRFSIQSRRPSSQTPYWFPPEQNVEVSESAAEAARRLRHILEEGVGRQLPSQPFALALSGGTDSNAVWALIHSAARNGDVRAKLGRPLSLVFPGQPEDESGVIDASLAGYGVDGIIIDASGHEICDDANIAADLVDGLAGGGIYHEKLFFEGARNEGRRILFLGDGGDEWFTGTLAYLTDLARSGRVTFLLRELQRLRPTFMRRAKLGWVRCLRPIIRDAVAPFRNVDPVPDWIGPSWRTMARERICQTRPRPVFRTGSTSRANLLNGLGAWQSGGITEITEQCAARFGVEPRSPLLDVDVINFAFLTPPGLFFGGNRYKHLLRLAVDDLFPEPLRNALAKASFIGECIRAGRKISQEEDLSQWALLEAGLLDETGVDSLFRAAKLDQGLYFRVFYLFECERFARVLSGR
jgi:asparagine synthase (glutamine-hydrolysing)